MFHQEYLVSKYFEKFKNENFYEDITKGREGGIFVKDATNIPIVRSITSYSKPASVFPSCVKKLIFDVNKKIRSCTRIYKNIDYNNVMIECYDNRYRKMKFHSDQQQDLQGSICIFSCYSNPKKYDMRQLIIKNKTTHKITTKNLQHNTFVVFSLETNQEYVHKIELQGKTYDTKWIGVTMRCSKTIVSFEDNVPILKDSGLPLLFATLQEQQQIRNWKAQENKTTDFKYPQVNFTLSPSDLLKPKISCFSPYRNRKYEELVGLIQKDCFLLQYMPCEYKLKLAHIAVLQNGLVLQHIKKKKRSLELCTMAYQNNPDAIQYVKQQFRHLVI